MSDETSAPAALEPTPSRGNPWRGPACGAALVVGAALAAWIVVGMQQRRAEQAARAELTKLQVVMATEPDSDRVKMVNMSLRPIDDAIVGHISRLSGLESLLLAETKVSDAQLASLSQLGSLLTLELNNNRSITDAASSQLERLQSLESLYLKNTSITDAALPHIAKLGALINLDLSQTGVTDRGLQELSQLSNLSLLALKQTAITDAGLAQLERCTALQKLYLFGTKVTPEGVQRLQRARPGLSVEFGE